MAAKPNPKRRLMKYIYESGDIQDPEKRVNLYLKMGNSANPEQEAAELCKSVIMQMLTGDAKHNYFDITFVITRNSPITVSAEGMSATTGGVNPHNGGPG
jgi:hypothetical protein